MSEPIIYTVHFNSASFFDHMYKDPENGKNKVELFCQTDYTDKEKEILFILPIPEDFNTEEDAMFSVRKQEAQLIINVLKMHFNLP
jgi:hypothetical protein